MAKHLQRATVSGHLLKTASGHLANECPAPCVDCVGPQNNAVLVTTAPGGHGCHTDCTLTYYSSGWAEWGIRCYWDWYATLPNGHLYHLYIYYWVATGAWTAETFKQLGSMDGEYESGDGSLACDEGTHKLSGTLNLVGRIAWFGPDCTAYTATVTIA